MTISEKWRLARNSNLISGISEPCPHQTTERKFLFLTSFFVVPFVTGLWERNEKQKIHSTLRHCQFLFDTNVFACNDEIYKKIDVIEEWCLLEIQKSVVNSFYHGNDHFKFNKKIYLNPKYCLNFFIMETTILNLMTFFIWIQKTA